MQKLIGIPFMTNFNPIQRGMSTLKTARSFVKLQLLSNAIQINQHSSQNRFNFKGIKSFTSSLITQPNPSSSDRSRIWSKIKNPNQSRVNQILTATESNGVVPKSSKVQYYINRHNLVLSTLLSKNESRFSKYKSMHVNAKRTMPPSLRLLNQKELTFASTRPNICAQTSNSLDCVEISVCNNEKTGLAMQRSKLAKGSAFMKTYSSVNSKPVNYTSLVVCMDGSISNLLVRGLSKMFSISNRKAKVLAWKLIRIARGVPMSYI